MAVLIQENACNSVNSPKIRFTMYGGQPVLFEMHGMLFSVKYPGSIIMAESVNAFEVIDFDLDEGFWDTMLKTAGKVAGSQTVANLASKARAGMKGIQTGIAKAGQTIAQSYRNERERQNAIKQVQATQIPQSILAIRKSLMYIDQVYKDMLKNPNVSQAQALATQLNSILGLLTPQNSAEPVVAPIAAVAPAPESIPVAPAPGTVPAT